MVGGWWFLPAGIGHCRTVDEYFFSFFCFLEGRTTCLSVSLLQHWSGYYYVVGAVQCVQGGCLLLLRCRATGMAGLDRSGVYATPGGPLSHTCVRVHSAVGMKKSFFLCDDLADSALDGWRAGFFFWGEVT